MGKKIIQPPFYNSGFYDTGAGGGGGGGNVERFFNNFMQSAGTPDAIILENEESNKDVFIKVNFVKTNTNSRTVLELLTNENVRVSRIFVSSSKYISNSTASGDNTAWGIDRNPDVITICNGSYRAQYEWNVYDGGCPFVENSFKKIQLSGGVSYQQIAIYKSSGFGVKPSEYIHNFVPYFVDNTDKGLIDEVTGIKYPLLNNTHVY